jgi:hypothetical protein
MPVHRGSVWRAIAVTKSSDWSPRVIITRDSHLWECFYLSHGLLGERKIYTLYQNYQ